jgi:hypothetical protein
MDAGLAEPDEPRPPGPHDSVSRAADSRAKDRVGPHTQAAPRACAGHAVGWSRGAWALHGGVSHERSPRPCSARMQGRQLVGAWLKDAQ